jgi:DNA-binding NarL/FixJ family response regulator
MFNRDAELAVVERTLDHAIDGPRGVAIAGVPGIGKTTIWRRSVELARDRGYRVLVAAPGESDATLAFAGLGDLFESLSDELTDVPDPQRRALASALSLDGAEEAPMLALPRAVLTVLRHVATEGPLAVAIDDEQWLDPASARAVAFALCRLRTEPMAVLLSRRTDSRGALYRELAASFDGERLESLTVAPLEQDAIESVLRTQLGRTIQRSLVRRIYAASGGNPLYALAIARELDTDHPGVGPLTVPPTLADLMRARLRRVDRRARDPMLVVGALSRPTLAVLQAALPQFTLSDLDSAVEAGIIEIADGRVSFTHPLLASTFYNDVPAARRRELHRVLADVLEDEVERARHLALGAEAPNAAVALAIEQAARSASSRGAPETAALLLEEAIRLTPQDAISDQHERKISAAKQHTASGNAARARDMLEQLLPAMPPGPSRARALIELAGTRTDDYGAAVSLLEDALANADDDDCLRARAESDLSLRFSNTGSFDEMVLHATRAVECAERTADSSLVAFTLGQAAFAEFLTGGRIDFESLDRAIELEGSATATTFLLPSTVLGQLLFYSDDLEEARPVLERMAQHAGDRGEEYDRAAIIDSLAELEWRAGNREEAVRHHLTVCEMREQGHRFVDMWALYGEALFAAGRGELDASRAHATEALAAAEQTGDALYEMLSATVVAEVDLLDGDELAAHSRIAPFRESATGKGLGFIGSYTLPLWTVDIEALIALGRLDEAERVAADLSERSAASANPHAEALAHRCRALLLAAQRELDAGLAEIDQALDAHMRRTLKPELARTLLEKGVLERRAKHKTAAKQCLEQALEILEPLGATIYVERARDELGRIGLRPAAPSEGLTQAQMRVVELVLEGKSNPEIARALYMGVRTVESHLSKVYRELGVRSRVELATKMAKADEDSPPEPEPPDGGEGRDNDAPPQ